MEILGYKIKEEYKHLTKTISNITGCPAGQLNKNLKAEGFEFWYLFGGLNKLKAAGTFELWLEPVYKTNDVLNVGDIVVVTKRHSNNYAKVGHIVKIKKVDKNSDIRYCVEDYLNIYSYMHDSWCEDVRMVLTDDFESLKNHISIGDFIVPLVESGWENSSGSHERCLGQAYEVYEMGDDGVRCYDGFKNKDGNGHLVYGDFRLARPDELPNSINVGDWATVLSTKSYSWHKSRGNTKPIVGRAYIVDTINYGEYVRLVAGNDLIAIKLEDLRKSTNEEINNNNVVDYRLSNGKSVAITRDGVRVYADGKENLVSIANIKEIIKYPRYRVFDKWSVQPTEFKIGCWEGVKLEELVEIVEIYEVKIIESGRK